MATTEESGLSFVTYARESGDTLVYNIPFNYLETSHVRVNVGDVALVKDTDYTVSGTSVTFIGSYTAIATGTLIKVYRSTPYTSLLKEFQDGTVLAESEIQYVNRQLLYILQEFLEISGLDLSTGNTGTPGTGNVTGYHEIGISNVNGNVGNSTFTGVPPNFYSTNTLVFHNGILLEPGDDYTLTGGGNNSKIVFLNPSTGAESGARLADGDMVILWRLGADVTINNTIADNTVSNAAIQNGAITLSKLASISASTGNPRVLQYNQSGDPIAGTLDYTQINDFIPGVRSVNWSTLDDPAVNAVDMGGFNINGVADPVVAQDAATKAYVDAAVPSFTSVYRLQTSTNNGSVNLGTLSPGQYLYMGKQTGAGLNGLRVYETSLGTGGAILNVTFNLGTAGLTTFYYFNVPASAAYTLDSAGATSKPEGILFKVGS